MARFHWTAIDASGQPARGTDESSTAAELHDRLITAGHTDVVITPAVEAQERLPEPGVVGQGLADGVRGQMPLPAVLRAFARDIRGRKSRRLKSLAATLDRGTPLDEAVERRGVRYSGLGSVIRAGVVSGRLGPVLEDYIASQSAARAAMGRAQLELLYPAILLCVGIVFSWGIAQIVLPMVQSVFGDFGTELPAATVYTILAAELWIKYAPSAMLAAIALACGALLVGPRVLGRARMRRMVWGVPGVGVVLRLSAQVLFFRVLATLLESCIPMPAALRLAGTSTGDAAMAGLSESLARELEQGESLRFAVATLSSSLPADLRQVLEWADRPGAFPDLLRSSAAMLELLMGMKVAQVGRIVEPLVIMLVAITAGFAVMTILLPLIIGLNNLS